MNINYEHIENAGTCNFCSRGVLNESEAGLIFPYNHVFTIKGDTIKIAICRNCLKEIKEET